MAEDERKYEILPGVKLPDYKMYNKISNIIGKIFGYTWNGQEMDY